MAHKKSPPVTHFAWGHVEVEGYAEPFKDVKLYPGGARAWDWTETGTHHVPGIQPADVEELLTHGATTVILSEGVHRRLQVCKETLDYLDTRSVVVYVLQTEEAIELYNHLRGQEPVGALIHSTC